MRRILWALVVVALMGMLIAGCQQPTPQTQQTQGQNQGCEQASQMTSAKGTGDPVTYILTKKKKKHGGGDDC